MLVIASISAFLNLKLDLFAIRRALIGSMVEITSRLFSLSMVESLNVSASAAILIYMLSQRMRLTPSIDWALAEDDAREMLFRWVMSSVKDSERILERQFGK